MKRAINYNFRAVLKQNSGDIVPLWCSIIYIDLITVLEAILKGRQTRLEIQCLYGNPMSKTSQKTSLMKNS